MLLDFAAMIVASETRIVLGVSGGIAAYKSADLCRRLIERGFHVRVVMTASATRFVAPLTFQAVSGNPVHTSLLDEAAEAAMGHIEIARWAQRVVIAPATANVLAKLANGIADDLLTTLCLATEAPIVVAPAMNQQMWLAAATQGNVATLRGRGVYVLGPGSGDQACGEVGPGRMLEPLDIAQRLALLSRSDTSERTQPHAASGVPVNAGASTLAGRRVLITAGPTREALDPVRYITNHSSGKMGYAVAAAARAAGAQVTLVSGPSQEVPPSDVEFVPVISAADMQIAVTAHVEHADIFIGAAAVADYRPAAYSDEKIKKGGGGRNLALERTVDIIASITARAAPPFAVGFAAETHDLQGNALSKLERKSLDMIAANVVGKPGSGFAGDENDLTVYWRGGSKGLGVASKVRLASELIALIAEKYFEKNRAQAT